MWVNGVVIFHLLMACVLFVVAWIIALSFYHKGYNDALENHDEEDTNEDL